MEKRRIVIAGMGFGGLSAARELSRSGHELVMVDRNNYHLFQPLLYQVATAGLEEESIAYPLRALVRGWPGARFRMAEIDGVDLAGKRLLLGGGDVLEYDYLILGAGSRTNFFGLDGVARHAFDLKRLDQAEQLRNHILTLFEQASQEPDHGRRRALLTFVIVGGGPTGVEFAGALRELIAHVLAKDLPEVHTGESSIILVEAADSLLTSMPRPLRDYAAARLGRMGVEVRLGASVTDATESAVMLADGTVIASRTLFWSAGVRAAPLADALEGVERGPSGRIEVAADLSLAGHPEVFVIGDMAACRQDGQVLPMMAPVASQQGRHAARSVLARIGGRAAPSFRYVDKGAMATIGRNAAVATTHGLNFKGYPAWVVWLLLHLYYLIGFRNRLLVMLNWALYYFFQERQVRLITSTGRETP